MSITKAASIEEICKRGSIKDADVARLRRALFESGEIDADEAQLLVRLNRSCPVQDYSWSEFFIEAMTDYVVNQAKPEGYVTAENAQWLLVSISREGRIETKTELELLVNVLDKARWSPVSLARFALDQVKQAVVTGEGPLRAGQPSQKGSITEGEVELLRRILYAYGGDGCVAVTRPEAEALFEISDAIAASGADVQSEWADLFTKAIANVVMSASGHKVPSREEALQHESWLEERGELAPTAFISKMVSSGLSGIRAKYREQSWEEKAIARLERQRVEIVTNELITQEEATWLAERLCRDGQLTSVELALVDYLKSESPAVHASLSTRIGGLTRAA